MKRNEFAETSRDKWAVGRVAMLRASVGAMFTPMDTVKAPRTSAYDAGKARRESQASIASVLSAWRYYSGTAMELALPLSASSSLSTAALRYKSMMAFNEPQRAHEPP